MACVIDESYLLSKNRCLKHREGDHVQLYNYDTDPLKSSNLKKVKETSSEIVLRYRQKIWSLYSRFDRLYNLRTWMTNKNLEKEK